jgi:hypothetical protein
MDMDHISIMGRSYVSPVYVPRLHVGESYLRGLAGTSYTSTGSMWTGCQMARDGA